MLMIWITNENFAMWGLCGERQATVTPPPLRHSTRLLMRLIMSYHPFAHQAVSSHDSVVGRFYTPLTPKSPLPQGARGLQKAVVTAEKLPFSTCGRKGGGIEGAIQASTLFFSRTHKAIPAKY